MVADLASEAAAKQAAVKDRGAQGQVASPGCPIACAVTVAVTLAPG